MFWALPLTDATRRDGIHKLHLSESIDINRPNPPHLPTCASQTIPSHKPKRMSLKILLQRRKSTPCILHSPRYQLPSTRAIIPKLLLIAKHLTVSIREKRQILLKLLERNLLVDDSLAHGLGHGGGHFRPGVECRGGAERLAFVLVRRGEDGADEFARVPDAVEVGRLGLRGGVASYDPGAIGGLLGRQEGLGLVILHEIAGGVEGALDVVEASDIVLHFRLLVEGGDLGVLAAGDFFDSRQGAEDDVLDTFLDRDVGDRLAAVVLEFWAFGVEGGYRHGEDGVCACQGCFEGGRVEHIAVDNFDLLLELLGLLRVGVTGDGTDLVLLV